MPPEPSNNPGNNTPNNGYRFYNVQREERRNNPSLVESGQKAAGTTAQVAGTGLKATGTTMRVAGAGMQAAGAATSAAGLGITAVGMGISATGVGAVIGAPIAAAGRVVGVGGKALGVAGKATGAAGKGVQRSGGAISRAGSRIKNNAKKLVAVAKVTAPGLSIFFRWMVFVGFFCLYLFQIFNAGFSIVFLGIAAGLSEIANYFEVLGTIIRWTLETIRSATGWNLNPADHMTTAWGFFHFMAFLTGIASLFLAAFYAFFTLKSPFWGRGEGLKIGVLIASVCFLILPVFNLVPWAMIWIKVIDSFED